ncbi:MAG: outer membrane protein assembly factor BamD, partial [Thermoanaerobaculales bacterium]|nr:outer membrane protein assembly factor BamD [Thermoanaerobaculales bacterium]
MTYRKRISMFLLPLALLAVGCKSTKKESDLLDSLANLDKETIYEQAEQLYSEKEYQKARDLFSFVYDTFPNDPLGHKAALRVADTYAVKTDVTSLTEARLRYRDFANRYPNDPDRDYALLMVGQTYSARKLRPDRDLSDIQEALAAYQQ